MSKFITLETNQYGAMRIAVDCIEMYFPLPVDDPKAGSDTGPECTIVRLKSGAEFTALNAPHEIDLRMGYKRHD